MTSNARQMPLDLPEAPPHYNAATFIRADANDAAWRAGAAWLKSDEPVMAVCGPRGAGKTHFIHALCEGRAFHIIAAHDFIEASAAEQCDLLLVDDMPADDPEAFLGALETGIGAGRRYILAGEGHPSAWANGLKDLRTRIEAAPRAVLADPDEALIRAVIAKGFRDRQVSVSASVIDYAAPRLPRTFAAAHRFVALADRTALEEKRKITTPFVQKLINNLSEGDPAA